jgi:hypothetical protein
LGTSASKKRLLAKVAKKYLQVSLFDLQNQISFTSDFSSNFIVNQTKRADNNLASKLFSFSRKDKKSKERFENERPPKSKTSHESKRKGAQHRNAELHF